MTIELAEDVDAEVLERAMGAVVAHHEALRTRFALVEGSWVQDVAPAEAAAVLQCVDLSGLDADAVENVLGRNAQQLLGL